MTQTFDIMMTYFSNSKLAGSYFLLFLVSIVILYYMNKEKNVWFILYGIVLLVVVIMNPIVVWALMQLFPTLESYGPITLLVPILFYIPFAATELIFSLKNKKIRNVVAVVLVFLIFICGNMCGLITDYSITDENVSDDEECNIVQMLDALQPTMVLADEEIIPVITARGSGIPLLYGRDLWTQNLDTGIMDSYNEEAYMLFDAMKDVAENADFIANMAYEYSCDVMVIDYYDDAPIKLGEYVLYDKSSGYNYLIYKKVD